MVIAAETAKEHPAPAGARAGTPTRDGEAARAPPPSNVVEEEDRAPTPPPTEEGRIPTPPRVEASSPGDSPGLDQGPVMPAATAGGSAEGKTRTASDDEVEEIQGRPQDGRQQVYVWRQRGDHFIGHEELTETEEAARVERAAKRLVDEVKVSGLLHCSKFICIVSGFNMYSSCRAQ